MPARHFIKPVRARTTVYGNGTHLEIISTAPVYATFTENVPEPASWALMVAGFGFVGGALRRTAGRGAEAGQEAA